MSRGSKICLHLHVRTCQHEWDFGLGTPCEPTLTTYKLRASPFTSLHPPCSSRSSSPGPPPPALKEPKNLFIVDERVYNKIEPLMKLRANSFHLDFHHAILKLEWIESCHSKLFNNMIHFHLPNGWIYRDTINVWPLLTTRWPSPSLPPIIGFICRILIQTNYDLHDRQILQSDICFEEIITTLLHQIEWFLCHDPSRFALKNIKENVEDTMVSLWLSLKKCWRDV